MLQPSKQISLLHDAQELFLINFAVAISVRLIDHLLELLIGHTFPKFLRHPFQVLERYLPGLVVVEEAERLQNFILRVGGSRSWRTAGTVSSAAPGPKVASLTAEWQTNLDSWRRSRATWAGSLLCSPATTLRFASVA